VNYRDGGEREDGTDRGKFQLQHDIFLPWICIDRHNANRDLLVTAF
jgi:hypothetical protein